MYLCFPRFLTVSLLVYMNSASVLHPTFPWSPSLSSSWSSEVLIMTICTSLILSPGFLLTCSSHTCLFAGTFLPQGLCTFFPIIWTVLPWYASLFYSFKSFLKCHFTEIFTLDKIAFPITISLLYPAWFFFIALMTTGKAMLFFIDVFVACLLKRI